MYNHTCLNRRLKREEVLVELTQPEIIQIFRRRSGMNQGNFGAAAFDTSYESGRTKIKNIELGKQKPTAEDIQKMAGVLGISPEALTPGSSIPEGNTPPAPAGILISRRCLERFTGLDVYVDMLNKAVKLEDEELIVYIADKISSLLRTGPDADVVNL